MDSAWVPLQSLNTPQLQANVAYLKSVNHELLSPLSNVSFHEPLVFQKQDRWIRCRTQSDPPLWLIGETDAEKEISLLRDAIASRLENPGLLILVGGTIGYGIAAVIPALLSNPHLHVVVVEPTKERIWAAFVLVDLQAALATERLHFLVGDLDITSIFNALGKLNLCDVEPVSVAVSPELSGRIDAVDLLNRFPDFACRSVEATRQLLADLSNLRTNAGSIERVMIVNCWAGAPGGLHIQSIERCLNMRGIQTRILPLNRYRFDRAAGDYRRSVEIAFIQYFREYRPNLILSFGYHAPQFVRKNVFETLNAHWVQMVSNIAYYDEEQYEGEWTFLAEERMIPLFLRRGYHRAFFLPLMANYVQSTPVSTDGCLPLVILGNSLALPDAEIAQFWDYWKGRDRLIQYLREAEPALGDFDAQLNLYDYLEERPIPQVEDEKEKYGIFRYLLCQSSAIRRIRILERLAPLGLHIFGSGWERSLPNDSPIRPCLRGYYPMNEEPNIFSRGTIFINTHTIGNEWGPNMRFFNVAGMGAFQISDCPQFDRYLTADREMAYCSTLRDFEEKTRYFLAHPLERDAIRERAQQRIRQDWTYDNWLDCVFSTIRKSNT